MKVENDSLLTDATNSELLRKFSIEPPKLKCSSENELENVCIHTKCELPPLFCSNKKCEECYKHKACFRVDLGGITA